MRVCLPVLDKAEKQVSTISFTIHATKKSGKYALGLESNGTDYEAEIATFTNEVVATQQKIYYLHLINSSVS